MTTASTAAATAEVSEIDASARYPLSLLIASGLAWLVVSGLLTLLNLLQAISPGFLAHCPVFTYGRLSAMAETALIYGWAGTAGLAVSLWLLGRLSGTPLRSLNWAVVGGLFWNLGVALGLVGIAVGEGTSISFLQAPRAVQPLLAIAFAAIAVPGVLAWVSRRQSGTFAAQWFIVAALFLFPWLFSAAQVALLWTPVRGVLQAVVAGWYGQGVWSLWLAPTALGAAYYLVPKITGRVTPSYEFAQLSFWTLLFIGTWTGARHLVGGPVPAWLPSMATAAATLLVFHYIVVLLNLRGAFTGGGTALKFVAFGLFAYVLGGLIDAVVSFRSVALLTQFTWFTKAQTQLAVTGAFSFVLFGAIYFLGPRLAHRAWPSTPLLRAHFAAVALGTIGLVLSLAVAGLTQGRAMADASVSFADIAASTAVWLEIAAASQAVLIVGNALFAYHFVKLVCCCCCTESAPSANLFRQPPSVGASAS